MRVCRIDFGTLAAPVRRADGTIVVEARIARTGVQTYRNADGSSRVEYRPDAEVTQSMQSMRLVPVTHRHPPVMLDASNAKTYAVGAVGENIRRDGEWIVAPLAIYDAATIQAMDAGKNQVSAGYECELVEKPGTTPDGQRYDAIQTQIAINHVATALDSARAGREAAARMDAAYADDVLNAEARNALPSHDFAAGDKLPIENEAHVRAAMSRFGQTQFASDAEKRTAYHKILAAAHKFGFDTTGFEQSHRMDSQENDMDKDEQIRALKLQIEQLEKASKERKDASDNASTERDAALGKIATLEGQVAALTAQIAAGASVLESEALKKHAERADAAEAKAQQMESTREGEIRRAAEVRLKARAVLGTDYRVDGKPDRVIQCDVIKKFSPKEELGDNVSAAYISSRFDSLVEAHMQNARSLARIGEVVALPNGAPAAKPDTREARSIAWHNQAINGGYRPGDQK